jgi:hypothetical protein
MAREPEAFLNRVLRRGEDIGLLASAAALILVEAGYVAWLERLPMFPGSSHPVGFLVLPPWYDRPRVEVTLLLTILGGLIASAAWGAFGLIRNSPGESPATEFRTIVQKRLKTAALYAVVAGADLLFIQFLRT